MKLKWLNITWGQLASPSARKVWIEIKPQPAYFKAIWSPSARKVWIEIAVDKCRTDEIVGSPSARKVWIEISVFTSTVVFNLVTFREEGVD